MKIEEMEKVFSGYSPSGKRVEAYWDEASGYLMIRYANSGAVRRFNEERYDNEADFHGILTSAGYHRD